MAKTKNLSIERLERRDLRAAFDSPWPEVDSLSLSFIPDGTEVGNNSSELEKSLSQIFRNADWQLAVLHAFQTWTRETNANIALSKDSGDPVGSLGFKQGDPRFGDIRIGAFPMENDVLAVANPYDPFIANTWVGDIFLNSKNLLLNDANDPSQSLFSIMLHEAGHVLGVGHSDDIVSPMFPHFQDRNSTLTSKDIGMLQKLYGTRKPDIWEGVTGNQTFETAALISFIDSLGQVISPEWRGDLASSSDTDFYQYPVPANTQNLDIQFNAQGISLLTAKLTIMNSAGKILGTSSATDPRNNNLHVVLRDLSPGELLFAKVEAADSSVFGVGTYEILARPFVDSNLASPPTGYAGESEKFFDGEQVLATTPGYVEHTYYEVEGNLSLAHPSQSLRVRSSDSAPELNNIFTIVVSAENTSVDQLEVTILDAVGSHVPYSIISIDEEEIAIQVIGVHSGSDYVVSIAAKKSISASDLASKRIGYELEVDFAHDGAHLETIVSETLDDDQPIFEKSYRVTESSQFHFALSASDFSNPVDSGLVMRIVDATGKIVMSAEVIDGATQMVNVFLDRGDYVVQFMSPKRTVGSKTIFQWSGITTSSPIGPQLRDTIREPVESKLATPLVTLQNYWSPDRSIVIINEVPSRSNSRSLDMIVISQATVRTKPRLDEFTSSKDSSIEDIASSQLPLTIRPDVKNRTIPSRKQPIRDSSGKTTKNFEQKPTPSDTKKSESTSAIKDPNPNHLNEAKSASQPAIISDDEFAKQSENGKSLSGLNEPSIYWLSSGKTQGISLFFVVLSGIVFNANRRYFERRSEKNVSFIPPNRVRLNQKFVD